MSNFGSFQQLHLDELTTHTGHHTTTHSKLDTIATNTANIKISTDSVNLNVDTLEALQTTNNATILALDNRVHSFSGHTNNTTAIGDGSDQLRVVPLGYDRTNGKAVSFLVDAAGHQQLDVVSSALPSGASTSANQSTINTSIGTGNTTLSTMNSNIVVTNSKLDTLEATMNAVQTAVEILDNTVSGSDLQVDVITMPTTTVTGTVVANLSATDNAVLDNMAVDLAALEVLQTTTNSLLTTMDGVLDASLVKQTAVESLLTTLDGVQDLALSSLTEIEGAVETLEACVSSNKVNVNIASGSTATDVSALSTHAKQDTIIGHLDGVEGKLDALETTNNANQVLLTATNSLLTTMDGVLDASLVKQTAVESLLTTLDGVQDNILTKLTAMDSDTNDIKTAVEILDNTVSGSEMQVDVVAALPAGDNNIGNVDLASALPAGDNNIGNVDLASALPAGDNNIGNVDLASALPAGTNSIGKLGANSGVDIGDVDVTSISAGTNRIGMVALKANENVAGSGTERHLLCDSAGHLQIDVVSAPTTTVTGTVTANLSATDNAVLDDVAQKLADIETAVQVLDNTVSGSEMQVDVVASLPAGDNNIGNVDLASALPAGTNAIGTVSLSATDNAVLDAIATDGDNIQTLLSTIDGVQDSALTKLGEIETTNNACQVLLGTIDSDTDAIKTSVSSCATDLAALEVLQTATNGLLTTIDGVQDSALTKLGEIETTNNACQVLLGTIDSDTDAIKTSVQLLDDVVKAEDAAHSSGDKGIMALAVHQTTGALLGANGDYTPLSVNVKQHLRSATELQTFQFTLPSSGSIGNGNMAETDVFQFHHKVESATIFVGSNNSAPGQFSFVLKGSVDGSTYFTVSSSLYSQTNFNDNDKQNYFTLNNFNIKHIKLQVSNASGSTDTFKVFICA